MKHKQTKRGEWYNLVLASSLPPKSKPNGFDPTRRQTYLLAIFVRAFSARAAPMAVSTSLTSSGGGSTAFIPSDSIQSSRHHPLV